MRLVKFDEDIDPIGLLCPLPVLKAAQRLRSKVPRQVLRLQADDPAAVVDVPHYCSDAGNRLVDTSEDGATTHYFIERR